MKLNKHILSFVLLLAFLLPVLACGRSSRPSVAETASQISTELKVAYLEANKLYEDLVRQESMLTADYRVWQESYSSMLAGAGDQVGTLDSCYEQSATVIAQAANAVFAADSEGNPLTAAQENQAFINALATGGTLYAGDITRCQEAGLQLMSYIRAERATLNNQRAKITDELRVYDVTQVGNLKIATVMHFYNQYGPQLAQVVENGEEAVLKALSAENGLDPLPIDFIGFPTAALKVQTNSARICDGYFAMYNGQTATVGNHNPKLFQAESDPVLGSCTLYRMAAYQYMNRLFLTVQASNRIDCGTDADIYSTVNEDCTVSP